MKRLNELPPIDGLADPYPQLNCIVDTVNELVRRENMHSLGEPMPDNSARKIVTNDDLADMLTTGLPKKAGLTYSQVAQICHEANRALCQVYGDDSQPVWDEAPKWQRDSALNGVIAIDEGKIRNAGDSHLSWSTEKIDQGWKYGEVKDPVAKTHPCLVPFHDLPYDQRLKDHLFLAVATALLRN